MINEDKRERSTNGMNDIPAIVKKMPASHKNVINHVLKKFIGNSNIDSVFLFGSCAKGIANKDSDIDIFVVTKSNVVDNSHEAFDVIYGSTDDIPLDEYISCDILTATVDEFHLGVSPLIKAVKREGVELLGLL